MTFIELLSEYHIMPQFPPGAVRQAEMMPKEVRDSDLKDRCDLTDSLIITIDGDDAKDFDDAVSLELMENGNYCLGVHIADVTHYVAENTPIDRAAFARGTSVYLVDTVIPMLPFELSNELCSLKPGVVRLTVSVFMEITPRGKVENYKICKSFIKSHDRMTYAKATKILEGDEQLCTKYSHLVSMLHNMKRLAAILNKTRVHGGSIEFSTHESKITLDKDGKPVKVERYPITVSNNIIEEFMLICNVTVAKHLAAKGLPCVYRVHEQPDFERIERLARVLPVLGVEFQWKPDMRPRDFQRILDSVSSLDTCDVVNYLVLRTMSKARYSEKNLGHFGLAFSDYCHFTSPIRRYSDVAVHRMLKESLDGDLQPKRLDFFKELAVSASVTASVTEVNAADAEIAWKNVKKAEYMADHIGEKHTASITHVTANGFFAELANTVEGFVPARTIEDDLYVMNENGLSLDGMRTKRKFTIGDTVEIKVAAVDLGEAKIDFEVVGSRPLPAQRRKSAAKRRTGKKELSRDEKKVLKKLKEDSYEIRYQRMENRKKADFEKNIFENAVTFEVMDILEERYKFKKAEKGFAGVTVRDMASFVVLPVYRAHLYETSEISLKNALVSASKNVKNTVEMLGESFGFATNDEARLAAEYVCAALRHFDACMKHNDISWAKREKEYETLMRKIRERKERSK
ncbi:MAG: VacB/RNase II family 3'-5' exoribonuclease [Clostridia bacterium]|nr:VacB/RNase II family 3'-5' exoribonuclease [Clostridia bacterium]